MIRTCAAVVCGLSLAVCCAADASAQGRFFRGYATASVGATAAGDVEGSALTPSASVSVNEESGWGAELDAGFAPDVATRGSTADLATVMVSLHWMYPKGVLAPYLLGGGGAVGVHGCLRACARTTTAWDLGFNAGGGLVYRPTDVFGLRGDARYVWLPGGDPVRPDRFGFWRISVGATLQWAIVP